MNRFFTLCLLALVVLAGIALPVYSAELPGSAQSRSSESSTAYAVLVSAMSWQSTPNYGVYSFPAGSGDGTVTPVVTGDDYGATYGAVYGSGKLLGTLPGMILGGVPIEMSYNIFDGKTYELVDTRYGDSYCTLLASTFDTATGNTYVFCKDTYSKTFSFGIMTTSSGYINRIMTMPADSSRGWHALGSTPEGRLYAIDYDGDLLSVDKNTGQTSIVGSTGIKSEYTTSGEIDPLTGKFMFIATNTDASSLYSIDVESAKAVKLYDFKDGEQFFAMHFRAPEATDTAPSVVRNLKLEFVGPSLAGTVNFDAPVTDINWDMGEGSLTYVVYIDGIEVARATTAYGERGLSVPVEVTSSGQYEISVKTISAGGASSVFSSKELWIGYDEAGEVKNFKAAYRDGAFRLSWDAPTGAHGGYFEASDVSYSIVMLPEGREIANSVKDSDFVYPFEKPLQPQAVSFSMTPVLGGVPLNTVTSNVLVIGDAAEPPFLEDFESDSHRLFTVIDANGDGVGFEFESGAAKLNFGHVGYTSVESDDWLVLPPLKMRGGYGYRIEFDACGQYRQYREKVAVCVATEASAEALAAGTEILPPTEIACDHSSPQTFVMYFIPEVDGDYYIGIHGCSIADQYALWIDNVAVAAGLPAEAPDEVTDIEAERGEKGVIALTLHYTAPLLDFVKNPLENLTSVEIYRDGKHVGTQTPAVGQRTSWVDPEPIEGMHLYRLVPCNEYGAGKPADITACVGVDKPEPASAIYFSYGRHLGEVVLTWNPVTTDVSGGKLDASDVTYKVYCVAGRDQVMLAEGLTECTFKDTFCPPTAEQTAAYYSVVATTARGDGLPVNTEFICLGKDYELPFAESFPDASLTNNVWVTGAESSGGSWTLKEDGALSYFTSHDNDNGYLYFYPAGSTDSGTFYSGRISLHGVSDAELKFFAVTPNPYSTNTVTVRIDDGSGLGFSDLAAFTLAGEDNMQWVPFKVNLKEYVGKSVRLCFAVEASSQPFVAIDDITVRGICEDDLSLCSFVAPTAVVPGRVFSLTAIVDNPGSRIQSDYEVEIYRDGELAASLPGREIAPDESILFTFELTPSALWPEKSIYKAVVNFAADASPADNGSEEIEIALKHNNLPSPMNLSGMWNAAAELEWVAPDLAAGEGDVEITNGIDDLIPFSIGLPHSALAALDNVGFWTMIDVDGLPTLRDSKLSYPNQGEPSAYMVFNDEAAGTDWEMFDDHDGDGVLFIAWASVGGRNDDWLVSPLLNEEAQTVSFFAKSLLETHESFEVLYSTTGCTPADFTIIGDRRVASVGSWEKITIDLPAGARYFAVRYVSNDNFALLLDEFSFIASGATADLELIAYKVYCNMLPLATLPADVTSYVHSGAQSGDEYCVTAVYTDGESRPTDSLVMTSSGNATLVVGQKMRIYTSGLKIIVKGAEGLPFTLAAPDGLILYQTSAADEYISVEVASAGIYILAGWTFGVMDCLTKVLSGHLG